MFSPLLTPRSIFVWFRAGPSSARVAVRMHFWIRVFTPLQGMSFLFILGSFFIIDIIPELSGVSAYHGLSGQQIS
jgi:hypothetical protein